MNSNFLTIKKVKHKTRISSCTDCQVMIDMAKDNKDAMVYRKKERVKAKNLSSTQQV